MPVGERAIPPARRMPERAGWLLLAMTLVAGLVYVVRREPPAARPVVRFQISPPVNGFFGSIGGIAGSTSGAAISPDGTRLAFTATDRAGRTNVWLRPLESSAARV